MAKQTIIFDAPREFLPRSPIGDDDTFQAMATFRALPNNQLELVDIEGYPVGEAGEAQETPTRIGRRGIIAASRARRPEPLPASSPGTAPVGAVPAPGQAGLAATRAPQTAVPTPGAVGLAAALAQRFRAATGRR